MRTRETHNLSHHVRNIRAVHPAVVPAFDQKWKIAVGGMGGSLVSQDAIFA